MSLLNVMRNPRYKVKPGSNLTLVIQTALGSRFELDVHDCSITGLLGSFREGSESGLQEVEDDKIIPEGKLVFEGEEISLGRMVVRRRIGDSPNLKLAFSTVDLRVPVDGKLSKALEIDHSKNQAAFDMELPNEGFDLGTFIQMDYKNTDLFDRTRQFSVFYDSYKKSDRWAYFFPRTGMAGPRVGIKRKRDGGRSDYLMFGGNDYLGMASHPEVIEASLKATEKYGVGSTGTAPTAGTSDLHEELAHQVARLYNKEDALIYSSGYGANVGIISGLVREQDLLVGDILSHASIQDGMTMARATNRFFLHNDMSHLEKTLQSTRGNHAACLILTEGLFSMDGTIGNLPEICRLAKQYNARTFVDQGHCIGVLGPNGLGTSDLTDTTDQVDLVMGLFSKGLGTLGGFVTGPRTVIEWLRAYSRSYMFATSFPPAIAAATLKSLELIQREPQHRQAVAKNVQEFVKTLNRRGRIVDPTHATPIVPVHIGDENKMGKIFRSLLNDGVFALPVIYPVVSKNRCRFRFSITAKHTTSDLDYAVTALEKAAKNEGLDLVEEARKLNEARRLVAN